MRRLLLSVLPFAAFAGCQSGVSPLDGDETPSPSPTPALYELSIVHIDVGQGDSTLIKGPEHNLLVDGGDYSMGVNRVMVALAAHNVALLDNVLSTHPHADHIGGLDEVLTRMDSIGGVWDNGETATTQAYTQYTSAAGGTTGGRHLIAIGQVFDLGKGAKATCVAVNGMVLDGTQVGGITNTNDRSAALLVEWGEFRYVIAGDLGGYTNATANTTDVETTLALQIGDVDVIRVSHHGSRYSTNPAWLNTLKPEAAVLSLGDANDYGHPSQDTLDRLTGADAAVTIAPVDLYLTEKGFAPSPFAGSGNVVIEASQTAYRIGDQLYDANGG